jgi:chitin synthase
MCNLHDVTWGTKGDNGAAKDLGSAKKIKVADGKEVLEVEIPTQREDVDSMWAASRASLRHPLREEKQHRDAETKQADHDRNSRTNVVLAWVGTNMLMIVFFTVGFLLTFLLYLFYFGLRCCSILELMCRDPF